MFLKRLYIVLLFSCLFFSVTCAQSVSAVKKEREKIEKEIAYLSKLLNETQSNKSASMTKLNILQQKITQTKNILTSLNKEVSLYQNSILNNETRITELEGEKFSMLELYSQMVYSSWKKRNKDNIMMFILSSSDFNQAYNRFKYFQQIQEYSKKQLALIQQVNDSLNVKNKDLKDLVAQRNAALNEMDIKKKELETEQKRENGLVNDLKKKEKDIKKKLDIEEKNRKKLTDELNKLISKQVKKSGSTTTSFKLTPEQQLVSDDFIKNKGRLPWPVTEGFISDKYGIKRHPVLIHVETNNVGIDITTSKNAPVRAIFNGEVTSVFSMGTYGVVVVVQHGNFQTVYTNIHDIKVKVGDKVKVKDILGIVDYDNERGNVLNFQIWKDNTTVNPELWLAK